jgi:hypothetical protein
VRRFVHDPWGRNILLQLYNAVLLGYAKFFSRSHDAVIRVYDESGNVIQMHEHKGDFKEW